MCSFKSWGKTGVSGGECVNLASRAPRFSPLSSKRAGCLGGFHVSLRKSSSWNFPDTSMFSLGGRLDKDVKDHPLPVKSSWVWLPPLMGNLDNQCLGS